MGSTAIVVCLMASPIVICVLVILLKQNRWHEDDYATPLAQRAEEKPEDVEASAQSKTQSAPNVIAIEDIRALAGIAEHPAMKRYRR